MVAIVSLLLIILAAVSFIQNRTISNQESEIEAYQDSLEIEREANHNLTDKARVLGAQKDSITVIKEQAEKESLEWQLKFYKQQRSNEDCKDKVSRAMLDNIPDNEQGRLLYDNARRYGTNRQPPS